MREIRIEFVKDDGVDACVERAIIALSFTTAKLPFQQTSEREKKGRSFKRNVKNSLMVIAAEAVIKNMNFS